jgi:hypothetical protein
VTRFGVEYDYRFHNSLMLNCEKILRSLHVLEEFVKAQQEKAFQQLAQLWEHRHVSFSPPEADAEIQRVVNRDNELLSKFRQGVTSCEKKELESIIRQMAGMGHYFCSYCSDERTLTTLLNKFYSDIYSALNAP